MVTKGKPLTAKEKETIVTLKKYFDRTKDDLREQAWSSIERVVNALGISIATVKRVMADFNRGVNFVYQDEAHRGRPPRVLSSSMQTATREYVRKANREGRYLTLEVLCRHLKAINPEQECSVRTLGRALDRWGFTFGKGTRTQRLKEKDHVIAARQSYLRRKIANRNDRGTIRPEFYIDESYVNKNLIHKKDFMMQADLMINKIAADEIIDEVYEWLCRRRKDYHPNNDIWHLRFNWNDIKPVLQSSLLDGTYGFEPVRRFGIRTVIFICGCHRMHWF